MKKALLLFLIVLNCSAILAQKLDIVCTVPSKAVFLYDLDGLIMPQQSFVNLKLTRRQIKKAKWDKHLCSKDKSNLDMPCVDTVWDRIKLKSAYQVGDQLLSSTQQKRQALSRISVADIESITNDSTANKNGIIRIRLKEKI